MRILLIHAEEFSYKVREQAVEKPEDAMKKEGFEKNVLVVFTTIERGDEQDGGIVERASEEIIDIMRKVNAENVLLYPYAHLSQDLAPPEIALQILVDLERVLKEKGVKVSRAPFGWYKEFMLKCYGHPLSELSRTIKPGVRVKGLLKSPTIYWI